MRRSVALALAALLWGPGAALAYEVRYHAEILPDRGIARVEIGLDQAAGDVERIQFAIEPDRFFSEGGDGKVVRLEDEEGTRISWQPPREGGRLRYSLHIDHARDGAEYDARCASSWMVVRSEDLFPPITTLFAPGARRDADASLGFGLPPGWELAHPFPVEDGRIVIEQEHRSFDQPKGWLVAGKLDRVEAEVAGSRIVLAAPRGHRARLRDMLAFLRFTLPELRAALGALPERILVASAGNPMWRGGLSAPASVYLHADRPLIEADASSPLLHELVHIATRARSAPGDDWIVEGIAEHYAREILRRSGAVAEETAEDTLDTLRARGDRVRHLEGEATGAETALATAFFVELDERIREETDGRHRLDDVVATFVGEVEAIDRAELVARIRATTGVDAAELLEARIPPTRRAPR